MENPEKIEELQEEQGLEDKTSSEIERKHSGSDELGSMENQPVGVTSRDSTTEHQTTTPEMANIGMIDETPEDHRFDEFTELLLCSLLLLFLAAEVFSALSQYLIEKSGEMIASVSSIFSLSLGIIACFVLFEQLLVGKVIAKPVVVVPNEKRLNAILRNSLSLVGLVFFCPFACILQTCKLFVEISCHTIPQNNRTEERTNASESQETEQANNTLYSMTIAFHVLFMLFMGLELLLCVQFRRLKFSENVSKVRGFLVKASLMVLVAVDLGLWFATVILEATDNYEFNQQAKNSKSEWTFIASCSDKHFGNIEEVLKRSLYPFTVEFCILSVEFVVSHMILDHDSNKDTEEGHSFPPADVPGSFENEAYEITSISTAADLRRRTTSSVPVNSEDAIEVGDVTLTSPAENMGSRRCMSLIPTSVIVIGIFLNVLLIVFALFAQEGISGKWAKENFSGYCLGFEIFYWIVLIILILVGAVCAINCKFAKRRNLQGFDYLVMVSVFGPLLSIVGTIILIAQDTGSKLPVAPGMLNLIQMFLQTPFLFYSDNVDYSPPNNKKLLGKILKSTILSLAVCNITLWFMDSVMPQFGCFEVPNPDDQWLFLQEICRPFAIFYRFNSCLLLLRAFLR